MCEERLAEGVELADAGNALADVREHNDWQFRRIANFVHVGVVEFVPGPQVTRAPRQSPGVRQISQVEIILRGSTSRS